MQKYSLAVRIMHWLVAPLMILMLVVGFIMPDLPIQSGVKWQAYNLHKSFGVIILGLVIARIIVRLNSKAPELPSAIGSNERFIAKSGALLLYILMLTMPLSGYVMSNAAGFTVPLFGLEMPKIISKAPQIAGIARAVHGLAGYAISLIIALHIAWTIKHYLIDKVNLIRRIT